MGIGGVGKGYRSNYCGGIKSSGEGEGGGG